MARVCTRDNTRGREEYKGKTSEGMEKGIVSGAHRKEAKDYSVRERGWKRRKRERRLTEVVRRREMGAYTRGRPRFMDFEANSWTRIRTPNNTRHCPIDPDSRWIRPPKFSTQSFFFLPSFSFYMFLAWFCPTILHKILWFYITDFIAVNKYRFRRRLRLLLSLLFQTNRYLFRSNRFVYTQLPILQLNIS